MARTVKEIQQEIESAKANESALAELNSTSRVSIWRLFSYIIAQCAYSLEVLFDFHREFVENTLFKYRRGRLSWYRKIALEFQYGFDLIIDTDKFNNENKTQQEIDNAKIIKYCAVNEADTSSKLIIKIATEKEGVLAPVTENQQKSFEKYINELKFGGVKVTVINYPADWLKVNITIVRNALVIDENGMEISTGKFPVNDVIKKFLKNLPFNGEFSIQKLEAKLLELNGVKDLSVDLCETKFIDGTATSGYGSYAPIYIKKIPFAGYFQVNLTENNENKSNITYV